MASKGGIVRSPQHHRRERTSHGGGAVRVSTASLDGGPHVGPPGGLHTITGERGLHTGDHEGLRNSCYRTLRLQSRVVRKWGGPLLVSQEILAFWLCCVFVAMQAFL